MPKASRQTAYLDAVTRARSEFVVARATLESRLREQLEAEMMNLQSKVDIAVRYAYDNGHSKSQILSAMGSKYYGMVNDSLERTEGISETKGIDPLDRVYSLDGEELTVKYVDHGPSHITATARFIVRYLAGGEVMLDPIDQLWDESFTVKNDAVAVLGGRFDGYYYEEALSWLTNTSAQ